MGQKANINSLHLSNNKDWNSVWYANEKDYPNILSEDLVLLNYLRSCFILNEKSEIIKIRVCRISKDLVINLQLTKALNIDYPILLKTLVVDLKKIFPSVGRIFIVSRILTDNELRIEPIFLSKKIAKLIENRTRFKSLVIKRLLTQTSDVCNGIKVLCKGRLNGADMAGSDFLSLGSIPFQTLDAKIAYGFSVANTPKGLQSIKVWVYNK